MGGVDIQAVFNTADTTYIALPANSPEHEIGEADLARMAAAPVAPVARLAAVPPADRRRTSIKLPPSTIN